MVSSLVTLSVIAYKRYQIRAAMGTKMARTERHKSTQIRIPSRSVRLWTRTKRKENLRSLRKTGTEQKTQYLPMFSVV